jgi:hypothetical protein
MSKHHNKIYNIYTVGRDKGRDTNYYIFQLCAR